MLASMFYEYSSHLYNSRRRSSIGEEEWKEKEKKEKCKYHGKKNHIEIHAMYAEIKKYTQ